jgi:hypothetical protein
MKTLVGIFNSQTDASVAYQQLRALGIGDNELIVLTPRNPEQQVEQVPTEEGEQPGMGKAIGSVVGGAMGLAAGAAVATVLLPGIGLVLAIGLGAAPLGIGGAIAGAATGGALEDLLTRGLPRDEVFLYEDALRQGRTVMIVFADDDAQLDASRQILENSGAESLDAAREKWWIGLREAGHVHYDIPPDSKEEQLYRRGFEAALEPDLRGKTFQDAAATLQQRFRPIYNEESFQRGYAKAQHYYQSLRKDGEGSR